MSYTSARQRPSFMFDALLEMKDAGLIAADDNAQVDSADKILDMGTGLFEGTLVVDVSAIEIASNDEKYRIIWQLSNSATFASSFVDGAILELGAHEVLNGDVDSTTGRHLLGISNYYNGTWYRYARVAIDVDGAIATGINFTAFVAPKS